MKTTDVLFPVTNESDADMLKVIEERLLRGEIAGVSIDSRTIRQGELFVAIRGDRFDGHDFAADAVRKGAWGALVERNALTRHGALLNSLPNVTVVEDPLRSLQELSLLHRQRFPVPLIAVTGSNGKTTTKEMLAAVLLRQGPVLKNEGNLNNHIGVPLTLLKLEARHTSAVVEMGMSGFGEIELLARLALPDVGIITNIGAAHLQFLGSTDNVAQAKGELLATMRPDGTAVLNADDRYFAQLKSRYAGTVRSFGIERDADVRATDIRQEKDLTNLTLHADGRRVPLRLRTVGRHNVYNALAAGAAALAAGRDLGAVSAGLEEFRPVAMRSELLDLRGRTVLADCYNANPGSMRAALETLASLGRSGRAVAVLGDMLEMGDAAVDAHREAGRAATALGIDILICVGPLARHIAEGAVDAGMDRVRVAAVDTTGEAAALLRERSQPGDRVLVKGSRGMKMETILKEF